MIEKGVLHLDQNEFGGEEKRERIERKDRKDRKKGKKRGRKEKENERKMGGKEV